ncbi:apolipoprotein L1-like [Haliotis rubra]|uniref:apolipoprotein L1-like n=1 Tax=Haliotis rubra TaxID=36100 RepID=UPI001EE55DC7|nr:apolipoprotein L1-like [Haliotis rubra]
MYRKMEVSPAMTVEEYECKIQLAIAEVNTQNDKTVKSLYDMADELDKAQRKMNIAKTSFASGGIVGAALTIAGIACAPATFGASLGLTIAGLTLGVTSGVGGVSTELANKIINDKVLGKAQQEANIYHEKGQSLLLLMDNMRKQYGSKFKTFLMDKVKGKLKPKLLETISSHGTTAVKIIEKISKTGTKGLKGGGIALCALTIPLNVHAIVANSIKIHKNTPSGTAEEIRRIAEELKDREAASVEVQKLRRRVEEMERSQEKHCQAWDEAKKKIEEDITEEMETIAIEMERSQEKHCQAWDEAKKKIEEDITEEMETIAIEYEYQHSAIAGIACAPATFGASLGLTIAGVTLGVTSG